MTATVFIALVGAISAVVVIAHSIATAPEGYQDEKGFHVGAPNPCGDDSLLENPS